MAVPFLPVNTPINAGGVTDQTWKQFFINLVGSITSLTTIVNAVPGVNTFTVATQPLLGVGDAGYLGWLSDYNHFVRWTGVTWEFFGGDGNGFFSDYAITPQGIGWQLCDGSVVNYLTIGALLTETAFTTPDLIATPAYRKAAAAYTGAINAKSGSTATGTTGTDVTGDTSPGVTGNTDDESAHTHFVGVVTTGPSGEVTVSTATLDVSVGAHLHTHTTNGTSNAGSAHHHGTSAITVNAHHHSVPGLSIPNLGVGTIDVENLGVLPYFRQ